MNKICQTQAAGRIMPKDFVENIDATDKDNELAATEYIDDIYQYYKLSEVMFFPMLCFVLCILFSLVYFFSSFSNVLNLMNGAG
jgi:hypothetical protein